MSIIQGTSKSSAAAAYSIDQSIRFNFSDGAHMLRTPSTASNRRTWTWSLWVKRSGLGNPGGPNQVHMLFGVGAGSCLRFTPSDELRLETPAGNHTFVTSQVFRDTSAWYHIVLAFDSTQATDTDRRKLYVNGSQVTDFSSTTFTGLAQNAEWDINSTSQHQIAKSNLADYFGGYLAELNFVDGQALAPTNFGETNADTGQWVPIDTSGLNFGTNGFRITGADSAALGDDSSGNGNDWTSSALSSDDAVLDSPTNNFCTWNPTEPSSKTNMSLQDGNLVANGFDSAQRGTIFVSSGKWYAELTISAAMSAYFGISEDTANMTGNPSLDNLDGYLYYSFNGHKIDQAGSGSAYGSSWRAAGKTVGVAVDMDNGAIWFSVDGVWQNSATISEIQNGTTTNAAFTGISGNFALVYSNGTAGLGTLNTGQSSFSYTQPTGFNAWSTANLPDPSIPNPSAYFDTLIWSGDSSNKNITGLDFTPDFLWIKQRNSAFSVGHQLYDVVRGAGSEKELDSSSAAAEGAGNPDVYGYPSAFVSGGFTATAGTSGDWDYVNKSGVTYVAWNWLADNTSGSSNTDGATSSTVSASSTSGFSIVKWTGTGSATTLGHGLGSVPKMIWVKNLADADSWVVYHEDVGATKGLTLNDTSASTTASTFFNNTAPTSSVFSVGSGGRTNGSSDGMIAYCFAEIPGFSSIGSYSGNSSSDGPLVYTGHKVSWLLVKCINASSTRWLMHDTTRNTPQGANVTDTQFFAELSNAESQDSTYDFLSNGFKPRRSDGNHNLSGRDYLYIAFAESPFKTATAR